MKILHIISSRGWGGAENSGAYLAKKQIESGYAAFFFIHSLNRKEKNILKENGVPYFSIFDPERKNIFAIKKIINICKKEHIDIIHTHLATANYLGVVAGNYLNIPVVSTIDIFSGFPYYALADNLCFVSNAVKEYFLKYFSSKDYQSYKPSFIEKAVNAAFKLNYKILDYKEISNKLDIAYTRVNESRFIGFKDRLKELEKFFNIGITGRVTEQKGQFYFIEAADLLLKSAKELKIKKPLMFHIVGNGKDEKKLKKIVEKIGIARNFKFWGYQSDVRIFVNTFDIAVSCSLNEPFGINNIEYMFMKKPCVATTSGGIPEVFGNTNMLITPQNSEKLKEALKTYINNPALMASEAERGYNRASELFKAEVSVAKIMDIYNKLILQKRLLQ